MVGPDCPAPVDLFLHPGTFSSPHPDPVLFSHPPECMDKDAPVGILVGSMKK